MNSRVTRTAAALALALFLPAGCLFSPEKKPPVVVPPIDYPKALSPQRALENMVTAYANRDSAQTDSVYHDNYQGVSTDPSLPGGRVDFTKANEVRHVGRLRLDPNIISVFLDLGSPGTWSPLPSSDADNPGTWLDIELNFQTVKIEDLANSTTWESNNRPLIFSFAPVDDASGDTIWKIIRWKEIVN